MRLRRACLLILTFISIVVIAQAASAFQCDNGKTLPISKVNDDYCDCNDGTDETTTNACPNGLFLCENKKFIAKHIPTYRLDDGYCDCCDGSDERGKFKCIDTCTEAAEESKKLIREEYNAIFEGLEKKKERY